MNQALIVTVAVLVFLVLATFCMRTHAPAIESRLYDKIVSRVADAGFDWADILIDGRNITLRGFAPSAGLRGEAERLLAGVSGVRQVDNQSQLRDEVFSPAVEATAYETRLMVTEGFVRYSGFVPSADNRDTLISRTRELFPSRRVEDEMVIRPDDPPDNWMDAMVNLQQRFATYVSGESLISDNRLNVNGEVPPGRDGETRVLAARLPSNFAAEINLTVARGESIASCQRRLDELMKSRINFAVASDTIDRDSFEVLDQLAQRIRECGGLRIEVSGHTDSEGLAMKNLELSQRRAEAVAAYLMGKGIDPEQIVPWGYGESRPIEDNGTAAGRTANRRIEFRAMN